MNRYLTYLLLFVALLLPVTAALAQSEGLAAPLGTGYTLSWWTVDSGGTTSSGVGGYTLSGTAGQPDIAAWSGGGYTLAGGFWGTTQSETGVKSRLYLPLVYRTYTVAPDLVVERLTPTATQIEVVIRNQGNAPVEDGFWVDVYFDPSPVPPVLNQTWQSIAPYGADWGVTQTLAPNETLSLTIGGPYYTDGSGTYPAGADVYAYVDSVNDATTYGNIKESDETNNVLGPVVSTAGNAEPASTIDPESTPPQGLPGR